MSEVWRKLGFFYGTPRFITDYPSWQPFGRARGTKIELWFRRLQCRRHGHAWPSKWSWKTWCLRCLTAMSPGPNPL